MSTYFNAFRDKFQNKEKNDALKSVLEELEAMFDENVQINDKKSGS